MSRRSGSFEVGSSERSLKFSGPRQGSGGDDLKKQEIAEKYALAIPGRDIPALGELMHEDIVGRFPQSGEVIRGRNNYLSMLSNYPGLPDVAISSVKGDARTASVPSSMPFGPPTITVFGGDQFIVEGSATYPNGETFNVVSILRLHEQQVIEETTYFATPFEAPEWRREYVELE